MWEINLQLELLSDDKVGQIDSLKCTSLTGEWISRERESSDFISDYLCLVENQV